MKIEVEEFYKNKKEFDPRHVGASELYLLSWIDAIERLDILMLEARHLQINIINDLREPALLVAIRYEEKYLWGKSWQKELEDYNPKELAKKWILSYPDRKNQVDTKETIDELSNNKNSSHKRKNIQDRLALLIDKIWHKGGWSQEQRANYYSLRAIQLLKREILRDKLELSYHALFISKLHQFQGKKKSLLFCQKNIHKRAEFMVLRGAILYKANKDYIERIWDYQYQFSKTVDAFVDDTASSNKYRRRDLGVYTDFLRNRTIGIYTEIIHLFNHLKIREEPETESLLLHNWMHSHTSRSKYYKNTVSKENVTHITTSYWMPERPDLQPIIAHEIAHKFVKSRFGDISDGKISYLDDDFSLFLLRIYAKLDDFSKNPYGITIDPKAITREVSCDFIAASIKGIKYVYAHFIELLGNDISFFSSLTRNGKDLDYDNLGYFSYAHLTQFHDNRLWYLRIKMILAWLQTIHHAKNSLLDSELIEGIDKVVEDILVFYESLALTEPERKKENFWRELTQQLLYIMDDSDKLTSSIKKWKRNKANDVFHKETGKLNTNSKYPRSVARTDLRVRNILYKTQRYMKTLEGRMLKPIHDEFIRYSKNTKNSKKYNDELSHSLSDAFEKVYGVGFTAPSKKINIDQKQDGRSPIYLHIYDIIWQSSMMRAKDLLFKLGKQRPPTSKKILTRNNHNFEDFLYILHFEFPMGRDLFSFALEFAIFDQDSPHDRLMMINHLLDIEKIKENEGRLYREIESWHSNIDFILKDIKKEARGSIKHRKKIYKIGKKISVLFNILNKYKDEIKEDGYLIPIYYFLKIKNKDKKKENLFHKEILEGFSLNNNHLHSLSIGYLVGNLSLSASYAQLREKPKEKNNFTTVAHNLLKQNTILRNKQDRWNDKAFTNGQKCSYFRQLGRYDIMFMNPSTSLTRCPLPFFPDSKYDKNTPVYDEKFSPFFVKKEMAIPFVLGYQPWNKDLSNTKILVTLRIKLKQRSYRLNFLYRLRKTCLKEYKSKSKSNIIENMTHNFQISKDNKINEDRAFLIDGADDVILLFTMNKIKENEIETTKNKKIKQRLDQIFAIQNGIYEDFMVDRTRLAFNKDCLKAIRVDNNNNYKAIIFIRLLEDRHLSPMNRNYIKDIRKKGIKTIFYKTPGEYDYYADITQLIKDSKNEINVIINNLSDSKYVDSINTKLLHCEK